MSDDPRPPAPAAHAPKRSPRRARFALPADEPQGQEGDRTSEGIEAFLDGPARSRRTRRRHLRPAGVLRPRSIVPLDSRADWERAMGREDARVARYGRAASVLVVDVALPATAADERHLRRVATAIRSQARETDRVAHVAPDRFLVLLPETEEREAAALADRVTAACRDVLPAIARVHAATASPAGGGSLADALRLATARLEA